MPRKLALAIGISDAPPLDYLRGAINGAHQFQDWADRNGYQSELLTDEETPVTIQLLREKLEVMLSPQQDDPVTRLILYFAGHGLIREAEEGLWLLSDWNKELRAVAVEVLKRRLYLFYCVPQIAIFADACRSLPTNMTTLDLVPDAVLGKGPARAATNPVVDKFIAAQDTAATFMVPGSTQDQDRCLFSGVLMEGLWGAPTAISAYFPGKVTSQSLAQFLLAEVPKRAATYKRTLNPTVQPIFPLGSDVYFGDQQPLPAAPVFTPWTDPSMVLNMGLGTDQPHYPDLSSLLGGPISNLGPASSLTNFIESGAGVASVLSGILQGSRHGSGGSPHSKETAPPSPKPDPGNILRQRIESQDVPGYFETGSGFAVEGKAIRAFWIDPQLFTKQQGGHANWWAIGDDGTWLQQPAPVLIELDNGLFIAQTSLPDFIGSALCDDRGLQALIYRESYGDKTTGTRALDAITRMESGSLRADAITDLSIELRTLKHADPVLGVISAYLYDSIDDVDSIRRMAYYYIQHHQAIPYDIALLAQITGRLNGSGLLEVDVPIVPAREPRTEKERVTQWTWEETSAATGIVAGFWPWMKQGWTFLDDPTDAEFGLIHPSIPELRQHLTAARFTTLSEHGGTRLAALMSLFRKPIQ
jgi:hypothetical protein